MRKNIFENFLERRINEVGTGIPLNVDAEYESYSHIPQYERLLIGCLTKLRENFISGKYSLVIGEDSSARVLSLVVADFAKKMAELNGKKTPEARFLKGERSTDQDYITLASEQLNRWLVNVEEEQRNILYVTESNGQGGSIANFVATANKAKAKVDVLIAEDWSDMRRSDFRTKISKLIGSDAVQQSLGTIVIGDVVSDVSRKPIIYKNSKINAVTKAEFEKRRNSPNSKLFASIYAKNNKVALTASRTAVKLIAENLYNEIAPPLPEVFKQINIPFSHIVSLNEKDRKQLVSFIRAIKKRVENDPRVGAVESGEPGLIAYDCFDPLIYSIEESGRKPNKIVTLPDYSKANLEAYYNYYLKIIKDQLELLESRPWPQT